MTKGSSAFHPNETWFTVRSTAFTVSSFPLHDPLFMMGCRCIVQSIVASDMKDAQGAMPLKHPCS